MSCLSENLVRIPYIDWVLIMGRIWVRHDMYINDWLSFVPISCISLGYWDDITSVLSINGQSPNKRNRFGFDETHSVSRLYL